VEDQCRWLRDIGFAEVDCFWKYFELAVFGGVRG
jgi:tRNA (cmo5U34)-methyltransferase